MFQSKKAKQAQQDIDSLSTTVANLSAQIADLQTTVKAQNTLLQKQQGLWKDHHQNHAESVKAIAAQGKELESHNDAVARETHNLRTARITIEKKTIEAVKQQVQTTLQRIEQDLTINTQQVDRLSDELASFRDELKSAKAAVARFSDAATSIKEADLALKNHAKALGDSNAEKLQLMKKIDDLESKMAKMIRGRSSRGPMRR